MITMTSALESVPERWYLCFLGVGIVYFAIIESKNLQKSSAIQKISVTLSSVINGDIFSEHLLFRHCKGTENIANYQIFNEL